MAKVQNDLMAEHIVRGREGEQLAQRFLRRRNFEILICNWRYRHYEIDIVAARRGLLHFIEVKTRHSRTFGHPEESVSGKKMVNLRKGAEHFLHRFPGWKRVQFDVLAITRLPGQADEYFFIEDVY